MAPTRSIDRDDVTEYRLFVDGESRTSSGDDCLDVEYPYTGNRWATAPNGTAADVDAGIDAGRTAVEEWSETLPSERRDVLHEIADAIEDHTEELAELETLQNGRLYEDHVHQVDAMAGFYRYYAGYCDKITGQVYPVENKDGQIFNYTKKEPHGVVGIITTWNAPLFMTTRKLAPALAAGNTVVHKPSEHAPVSAVRFAELLCRETSLPAGVYNVVTGDEETGRNLSGHGDLDALSFTGSREVGRAVGKTAAREITPATLQLGANNPTIVFPSSDLDDAVLGAIKGIFTGSGEGCTAGARILVHERLHDEFVEQFTARAADIELGDPMDPETEMGPLAYSAHRDDVLDYVDSAVGQGATLELGGEDAETDEGLFVPPTVLTDVDPEMAVAREEVFGPVATVHPFSDEDEAVSLANDPDYGLVASVWTEDMRQAHRLTDRLDVGTVFVNESRQISYGTPFGGYDGSGFGREHADEGIEEYVRTKSVWVDLSGDIENPFKVGTQ